MWQAHVQPINAVRKRTADALRFSDDARAARNVRRGEHGGGNRRRAVLARARDASLDPTFRPDARESARCCCVLPPSSLACSRLAWPCSPSCGMNLDRRSSRPGGSCSRARPSAPVSRAAGLWRFIVRWRTTSRFLRTVECTATRVTVPGVSLPTWQLDTAFPLVALAGIWRPSFWSPEASSNRPQATSCK